MTIAFGKVEKYVAERGFGFVNNELPGAKGESYFFHIKDIKKERPDLVAALESGTGAHFWYSLKESPKGKVAAPLDQRFWDSNEHEAEHAAKLIEQYWARTHKLPGWLESVTLQLIGADRAARLAHEWSVLEAERKRIAEEHRKLQEAQALELKAKQEAERAKRLAEEEAKRARKAAEDAAEEAEFEALVSEVAAYRFTESSQVSNYIVRNRLGHKYKKISGYLTMELDGRQWEFKGGFPPKIYARLCDRLGLGNNGTRAKVVEVETFESHRARTGDY